MLQRGDRNPKHSCVNQTNAHAPCVPSLESPYIPDLSPQPSSQMHLHRLLFRVVRWRMLIADVIDVQTLFWIVSCRRQIRRVRGHFFATNRTIKIAVTNSVIGRASSAKSLSTVSACSLCNSYFRYFRSPHFLVKQKKRKRVFDQR